MGKEAIPRSYRAHLPWGLLLGAGPGAGLLVFNIPPGLSASEGAGTWQGAHGEVALGLLVTHPGCFLK